MAKGSIKPQASVCCSAQIRRMELEESNRVNKYTSSTIPGQTSLGPKHAPVRQLFRETEELHWQERTSETFRLVHQPSESCIHQYKTSLKLQVYFLSYSVTINYFPA